jgi:hypothetical protein
MEVVRHINTFGTPEAVVENARSGNSDLVETMRMAYICSVELMNGLEQMGREYSVTTGTFFQFGIDWPAIYHHAQVNKQELLPMMRQAYKEKVVGQQPTPKSGSKPKAKLSDLQEQRKQAFKQQPTSEQLANERQSVAEKKKAKARAETVNKKRAESSLQATLAAQSGYATDSGDDDSITEQMGDTVSNDEY